MQRSGGADMVGLIAMDQGTGQTIAARSQEEQEELAHLQQMLSHAERRLQFILDAGAEAGAVYDGVYDSREDEIDDLACLINELVQRLQALEPKSWAVPVTVDHSDGRLLLRGLAGYLEYFAPVDMPQTEDEFQSFKSHVFSVCDARATVVDSSSAFLQDISSLHAFRVALDLLPCEHSWPLDDMLRRGTNGRLADLISGEHGLAFQGDKSTLELSAMGPPSKL